MIESERLLIYPVGNDEIKQLINSEKDCEIKKAYSEMLQGCIDFPDQRLWYTVWYIELKDSNGTIAGDMCFKGLASDGTVELGYGLREGFCGRGYMTEAVKAISEWALMQNGVLTVEAETAPDNRASQKVLLNAGYVPTGVIGEEGPRYRYKG